MCDTPVKLPTVCATNKESLVKLGTSFFVLLLVKSMTSVLSSIEGSEEFYQPLVNELSEFPSDSLERRIRIVQWSHFVASLLFLAVMVVASTMNLDATITPIVVEAVDCENFCGSTIRDLSNFNFRFFIPLFTAFASIGHLFCFFVCFAWEDFAEKWLLTIGSNPVRWIEFSLTYSLITVIAAIMAGIMDVLSWFLLFALTALCMGLWQLVELIPRNGRSDLWLVSCRTLRLLSFAFGVCAVFVPWIVILCYYGRMVSDDTPRFVSVMVLGLFVLYVALALNVLLSKVVIYFDDFCIIEMGYIVLSLITKLLVAVTLYVGLK